jgi:hypothetical protein
MPHEFDPQHVDTLYQKQEAMERLEQLGNVWIGPDAALDEKTIIEPGAYESGATIRVNKKHFPSIELNRGTLGALSWSVRSCMAQSGTDILFYKDLVTNEMLQDLNDGNDVSIPIHILNHVDRPKELEGNVMRFFWVNEFKRLKREKLREIIGKDLIIEGEEGTDWSFQDVYDDPTQNEGHPEFKDVCIRLPLREKFYIPPSDEVIQVKSKADLPNVLQEIPEGEKPQFKISETANVKLGPNVTGVVHTGGYDEGRHIYSPLIDAGFEGPIRTETLFGLSYIELFVYKK